ncbi:putative adenylate kinase [Trypanosoma cruzi]|uniref:Adenylate kinase, putative n=2 Tax=Trypanosoma cruzi TaxID=5693 RepID=Q4DXL7_TRYCC|nr:adenylate kinase, putative [Trypanosoma cruzi]AAS20420.1 adenylate kinase 6 [Trypanosoma cruzi]EAN97251.1 adenylate kinase, putative [Trypanosoma cruzi]PWV18339.1 putative adenylate kinase [Trypanosoma cruzi]RNC37377.1 adenylate kinase [Trypanosoma cruzi]|eukprot:XP_819102.1 adenylate kinase [Trypanosoma cruzi strain CL Brener]
MKFVLMGAPGCGKGTQSPFITERYGVCHLSTGDMLRDAVAKQTAYGKKLKAVMNSGALVSDDLVFSILKEGIARPECKYGYVLDGYPRTLRQAQLMEEAGEKVDKVILFDAPDDVIVARTSGRWMHRASGRTYHEMFRPPKVHGKDDVTGEPLIQRADDRKEVVEKRLEAYRKETEPLINYYMGKGLFERIDADRSVEAVRQSVISILDPIAVRLGLK